MGCELDLHQAVVVRLQAMAAGTGYTARDVYDVKPQSDPPGGWPYLTVTDVALTGVEVDGVDKQTAVVRVHSWSDKVGLEEVLRMKGEVYAALHDHDFGNLPGYDDPAAVTWRCVLIRRITTRNLPEEDARFHGVCEYRAFLERVYS